MPDSEEFLDPYLDPETGILRNLIGARTKKTLDDAEGSLSFTRLVQLMDHPPKPTGDLAELRAVHRHLFQDLYDWAGQLRTVDIRKNVEGAEFFLPSGMIERASAFAAGELHADGNLCGLDRERFIERLAYHYDQVNYIHPFREGNGRVQRVFWNRIAPLLTAKPPTASTRFSLMYRYRPSGLSPGSTAPTPARHSQTDRVSSRLFATARSAGTPT